MLKHSSTDFNQKTVFVKSSKAATTKNETPESIQLKLEPPSLLA